MRLIQRVMHEVVVKGNYLERHSILMEKVLKEEVRMHWETDIEKTEENISEKTCEDKAYFMHSSG